MKSAAIAIFVLSAAVLGISSCKQTEKQTTVSPAAMSAPEMHDAATAKLDFYTEAYHYLMNAPDSLRPSYSAFSRIKKTRSADALSFSPPQGLIRGLDCLKKGAAVQGGDMEELDSVVREALLAGFKLQKDELELEPYFKKQEFREDKFAKAIASYPAIEADYEAMFAHLDRMEELLFKYRKRESDRRMEIFQKNGNQLGYYTEECLQHAQELLAVFSKSDDSVKDASLYAKGDEILHSLEKSLASQRKAFDEARKNNTVRTDDYPDVSRILSSFIGSYRDLRQHRAIDDMIAMYKKYHDALAAYKRATRFQHN